MSKKKAKSLISLADKAFRLHVFNWGMGVESTAILLRWICEPESRPFESWDQVIVLVAQTGNEYAITKFLCETYILPLLRELGVRVVQVARAGKSQADGYTVLDDTTSPTTLYVEGDYTLGEDMEADGYVPRLNRPHYCAIKWKGWVLDGWIIDHIHEPFGPYLGYNCEELDRAAKSEDYGCQGFQFRFPAIDWDWTRQKCIDYIYEKLGVIWHKSCCDHCPFQNTNAIAHWTADPVAGARALWREHLALAMNHRMALFGVLKQTKKLPARYKTAYKLCVENQIYEALELFEERRKNSVFNLYRVRRIYKKPKKMLNVDRKVDILASGNQADLSNQLIKMANDAGAQATELNHHLRWILSLKDDVKPIHPTIEEFYVVAPDVIQEKCRSSKSFEASWEGFVSPQLELFNMDCLTTPPVKATASRSGNKSDSVR